MERNITLKIFILLLCALFTASGCAPIAEGDTIPTKGTLLGAGVGGVGGAGVAAALHGTPAVIGIAGVTGATLGYYLSTQRFAARGIVKARGKVYTMGDYLIIDLPTDNLFDTNTADFYDNTDEELQSVVSILGRLPKHNIIISGNTSGFGSVQFQNNLSQQRASKVASYLWLNGINDVSRPRTLIYVGYGNSYPIATDLRLSGLRANSRIQIVAYPCSEVLHWDKIQESRNHFTEFKNIGSVALAPEAPITTMPPQTNETPDQQKSFAQAFSDNSPAPPVSKPMQTKPYKEEASVPYQEKQLADAAISPEQTSEPYNGDVTTSIKDEFADNDTPPVGMAMGGSTQVALNDNEHNDIDNSGGIYNNSSNDTQAMIGRSVKKHWGFKGDNELKDETPLAPPTAKG
jgi:outer membrane protein OmpA-like peptidoglycan-associated protein